MEIELWAKGPIISYADDVFSPSMDSVLLADFARKRIQKKAMHGIDLGCGSGIISIILAWDIAELSMVGVDIEARAAFFAQENARANGLSDRLSVMHCDLRMHREFFDPGSFDFAISNPPYFSMHSSKASANKGVSTARREESCTLDELCAAAGYLTRRGGSFFLVYRPERLSELFSCLTNNRMEPKTLRFVHHNHESPPSLVLVESRVGGNPGLEIQAPLLTKNSDGSDTDEINAIYKR